MKLREGLQSEEQDLKQAQFVSVLFEDCFLGSWFPRELQDKFQQRMFLDCREVVGAQIFDTQAQGKGGAIFETVLGIIQDFCYVLKGLSLDTKLRLESVH